MSLTINSFGNNSIYSLFGGNSGNSVGMFGGLEGSLSNYTQIRSGSFGKLIKSYYDKYDSDGNLKSTDGTKKVKADTGNLGEIRNDTSKLSKAADKLLAKGKDSIWEQKESTDVDGNVTKEYDKDAIVSAVKNFASAYNDLIDSGKKAESTGILTQVAGMATTSAKAAQTLGKAGISVDKDAHLVVDEDFLKNKANMTYVKDLFNGVGSYAYQVAGKANMANSYASTDLSKITGSKAYTNTGSYNISADDIVKKFDQTT